MYEILFNNTLVSQLYFINIKSKNDVYSEVNFTEGKHKI